MRTPRTLSALTVAMLVAGLLALAAPAAPAGAGDPTVDAIVARVNAERAAAGLGPLTLCGRLVQSAQDHTQDQANRNVMTHTGWDGSNVGTRVSRTGYSWSTVGENVAYGYPDATSVMNGWMGSPGHRANILYPHFTHIGVGVATGAGGARFWTQDFAAGGDCGPLPSSWIDPQGALEVTSSPAPERLRVAGWALDPDVGAGAIDVHVYVGPAGYDLGPVSDGRPDLAVLGHGTAHGFDRTLVVAPGTHQVCAIAINQGPGGNVVLGCRSVTVAARPVHPVGNLDLVATPDKGEVRVAGWAADPDAGVAPIDVHLYIDQVGHDLGPADGVRPDLTGTPWGAAHGFDATVAATPGAHQACVWAINQGPGANVQLGCASVWVADPLSPFLDVLSTDPLYADIVWLADQGITTGYPNGTFAPTAPVQRGALAAFLYRQQGSPPFVPPLTSPFSDVAVTHPLYAEIAWAADQGVTTGFADGTFRPGTVVRRGAMAAFLHRLAGDPAPPPGAPTFTDVPSTHPFHDDIAWMAGTGLSTGYPDGTYRPAVSVSRKSMAAFLHRWADA